ncbi:hypothetical protein V1264_008806 [Littorina saxatilis]
MCRKTATYTLTHGVSEALKAELFDTLKDKHFSLNIDEATNHADNKVVNVVVRYFCEKSGEVKTQLLGSFVENYATAQNIFAGVGEVLDRSEPEDDASKSKPKEKDTSKTLPWENVVSCLMDNCNVMRGKKGGVETLIRKENKHLLDVHGDTVHIVSNAAKDFCKKFDSYLETLAGDLFYDFKLSPKAKELFKETCALLNVDGATSLLRPVESRFLQMLAVSERILSLLDPLLVFYYGFLSSSEQKAYKEIFDEVLTRKGTSAANSARLTEIHREAKGCHSSKSDRKDRILLSIFHNRRKTRLLLDVYRGILPKFQNFVKMYQHERPLVHKLHVDLYRITRDFMSLFIKPDDMPESFSPSSLRKVDCKDKEKQVADKRLPVGPYAYKSFSKYRKDPKQAHWIVPFQHALRAGFEGACCFLQVKLPLENPTLANLAALDPELRSEESTVSGLIQLAASLPNVITSEQSGLFSDECRHYCSNDDLLGYLPDYLASGRVDLDWWHKVSLLKKDYTVKRMYPLLSRLVFACLSVFTGPFVEGTFNIMDDIIEKDRSALTSENYEAIALTKYALRSQKKTSSTMEVSHQMRVAVTSAHHSYTQFLTEKKLLLEKRKQKRIDAAYEKLQKGKQKTAASSRSTHCVPSTSRKPNSLHSASAHNHSAKKSGPRKPSGQASAPRKPSAQASAPRQPSAQASASQQPSAQASAPQKPSAQASAPQKPSAQASAPRKPSAQASAPRKPSSQAPASQQPSAQASAPRKPSSQAPASQQPSAQSSTKKSVSTHKPSLTRQTGTLFGWLGLKETDTCLAVSPDVSAPNPKRFRKE